GYTYGRLFRTSRHPLQSLSGTETTSGLRDGFAVDHHHIRGKVKTSLEQPRPHTIDVDRDVLGLELADLVGRESPRDDDLYAGVSRRIQGAADIPHQLWRDPGRLEVSHLGDDRAVDHRFRCIQADAI